MLTPTRQKYQNEVRTLVFDFTEKLSSSDTLTGTPTVTSDSGITTSSVQRVGNTVSLKVSGGVTGGVYRVACRCGTTLSDTLELDVIIKVTLDAN